MLRKWGSENILIRHPDDVKRFEEADLPEMEIMTRDVSQEEDEIVERNLEEDEAYSCVTDVTNHDHQPRRSSRQPVPNRRYYNNDFM